MSASLHLARPEDLERLLPLVAAMHAETGIAQTDEGRRAALVPLLDGSPHGVAYMIGPQRAPIGYVVVTFGWSLEFGGLDGFIDEIFIRPSVRGRGIASEVLGALWQALRPAGLKALHLEVARDDHAARRLYERCRFVPREGFMLMSRVH
jgi:ribosomal protein S18 acetylase RimI-like enzyme